MTLAEIIKLESCSIDLGAKNKDDALRKISELFKRSEGFAQIDLKDIYKAFKAREALGSTGFARGIAMPHCQLKGISNFYISIAICKKGVDFDSIDAKKARIFVSIVGPMGRRKEHLQLLAACSHILREPGVTDELLAAKSRINLYEEFLRHAPIESAKISSEGKEKLLMLIVKDEAILEDIAGVFIEYGIEESIIVDGSQMEHLISQVPLFMGFFDFTGDKKPGAKLVLAKVMKEHINAIITGLEDIFGDLDLYSDLKLLVLDLFASKGF